MNRVKGDTIVMDGHAFDGDNNNNGESECSVLPANYEKRRDLFCSRIQAIKQEIVTLTDGMNDIGNKRCYLTILIYKLQQRALFLRSELDRVGAFQGNKIASRAIHSGTEQIVQKKELLLELEMELETTRSSISEWTVAIIFGLKEEKTMPAKIHHQQELLRERQIALKRFEIMGENVVKIGKLIRIRGDEELIPYCFFEWLHQASIRVHFRRVLQRLLLGEEKKSLHQRFSVLKNWRSTKKVALETYHESSRKGDLLLAKAAAHQSYLVMDASCALQSITQMKQQLFEALRANVKNFDVETWLMEHDTTWFSDLPQSILTTVIEGDAMISTHHYSRSLKCYEAALTIFSTTYCAEVGITNDVCQAYIYGRIGNANAKLEQWSIAVMYHDRQYAIALEAGNLRCQIKACLSLGFDFQGELDYTSAKERLDEALSKSISEKNKPLQAASHRALQLFCEKMNFTDDALIHGKAIHDMVFKRKDSIAMAVDFSMELQARLMNVTANERDAMSLEKVTHSYFLLRKRRATLEGFLTGAHSDKEKIAADVERIRNSLEAIYDELRQCRDKGTKHYHSKLLHGVVQVIDSKELERRLKEEAKKLEDNLQDFFTKEKIKDADIKNFLDDLETLKKDISVEEGPLVSKAMKAAGLFRCIQFNATNTSLNDADCCCISTFIPSIAVSKGSNIYVHDLHSGILNVIFNGDEHYEHHTGEPLGHTAIVTCIFFRDKRIYSGSMDKLIMCWDIETEKRVFVAKGHEGTVTCLWVDTEKMVSGSADSSMIVWNKETGTIHRKIFGHMRGILSLECGLTWCVSGGSDGVILVWQCRTFSEDTDYDEFKCKAHLRCESTCKITALCYGTLQIVSGNDLGHVALWWLKTGEMVQTCHAHHGSVTSLKFDATRIVSAGVDGNVCVIDLFTGSILVTLRSDKSKDVRVEAIVFDSYGISSAYADGSIRRFEWVSSSYDDTQTLPEVDTFHLWDKKDKLLSVCDRYGTPMADILLWNDIKDGSMLQSGMRLVVRKKDAKKETKQLELTNKLISGGLASRLLIYNRQENQET